MQYRKFDKMDLRTSLLGIGCMRFPDGAGGQVDREEAVRIIRAGIDRGITYIDTAYTYHGGESERIVGSALKEGYREKVILADKMPVWLTETREDCDRIFRQQLERLETDCIDLYLVHNLSAANWKRTRKAEVLPFLEEKKAEGRIRHIGFSFHDSFACFQEILDAYPWEFCQIQLNYMDRDRQAGVRGLKYAAQKGLGVIVMEPLKGGRLTDHLPPTVQKLREESGTKRTPAELAFKWLASMPEVTVMLSGMSSMEQLVQNVQTFSAEDVSSLTSEEKALVDKLSDEYNRLIKYSCTDCKYCMPCAEKLDIPRIIAYYNDWHAYGKNDSTRFEYATWIPAGHHASDCVGCKACEDRCPQGLPVPVIMKEAAEAFGL